MGGDRVIVIGCATRAECARLAQLLALCVGYAELAQVQLDSFQDRLAGLLSQSRRLASQRGHLSV